MTSNNDSIAKGRLLQELVDNIPDVIYFKDKEGRLILVNKAHADGLGLTPQEVVGKSDFDFFPKEQALQMTQDDLWVMETGVPVIDKIEHTTQPNGTEHWVSTTKLPRQNENGKIIGVMGITRDITERKQFERQQEEERQKASEELTRLKDRLELEKTKLEQILQIDEELNSIVLMDDLFAFIVDKTTKILSADKCSLLIYDYGSRDLRLKDYKGLARHIKKGGRINYKDSIVSSVIDKDEAMLVQDIETDKRFLRKNRAYYKSKSFMSVPFRVEQDLIGIINVSDKNDPETNTFTPLDLKILSTLVRQVAVAIENAQVYRKLKTLAISDPLTDMYNYRYFAKTLDDEIKRMRRYAEPLCLLMIDIDDFKSYNDDFGHIEGDNLIKAVGEALTKNIREVDIGCRYAGDEFVVILPKTTLADAVIVADKIKEKINQLALRRQVGVSIGVAQCGQNMDRHGLVLRADKALYKAKRQGKNKVCLS